MLKDGRWLVTGLGESWPQAIENHRLASLYHTDSKKENQVGGWSGPPFSDSVARLTEARRVCGWTGFQDDREVSVTPAPSLPQTSGGDSNTETGNVGREPWTVSRPALALLGLAQR